MKDEAGIGRVRSGGGGRDGREGGRRHADADPYRGRLRLRRRVGLVPSTTCRSPVSSLVLFLFAVATLFPSAFVATATSRDGGRGAGDNGRGARDAVVTITAATTATSSSSRRRCSHIPRRSRFPAFAGGFPSETTTTTSTTSTTTRRSRRTIWDETRRQQQYSRPRRSVLVASSTSSDDDSNDVPTTVTASSSSSSSAETAATTKRRRRRARFAGVSVSPTGFWVILELAGSFGKSGQQRRRRRAEEDEGEIDENDENDDDVDESGADRGRYYWPVRVTDGVADRTAATSPEALTILQLLSGVDMAGAILPPDVLARTTVSHCEERTQRRQNEPQQQQQQEPDGQGETDATKKATTTTTATTTATMKTIAKDVQSSLPKGSDAKTYRETHEWFRSRTRLPVCTLDEVQIVLDGNNNATATSTTTTPGYAMQVAVKEYGTVRLEDLSQDTVNEASWNYNPETSPAFLFMSLALRYKAPVVVVVAIDENEDENDDDDEIDNTSASRFVLSHRQVTGRFPMYKSREDLVKKSTRIAEDIERGFEIHKWQSALQMALNRNDAAAATKIRAKIDQLDRDSFSRLPVQPDSDIGDMQ